MFGSLGRAQGGSEKHMFQLLSRIEYDFITIFIHSRLFHVHCIINTILCCAVVGFNDAGCCWVETALKILGYLFVLTAFCVIET